VRCTQPVDAVTPAVELGLEVDRIGEPPAGLEVGAHKPVRTLQHALGLRVPGLQDDPADAELPAEAGQLDGRPAAAGMDRALTVEDQLLRQHPDPAQAAPDTPQDVRRLPGEDQRARDQP
jgi:hypothetical protein